MAGEAILVVDKSRRFLENTEQILRKAGYRPVLARSGSEVLDLLPEVRPAVLLVGLTLKDMAGTELTHRVKFGLEPELPCVLLFQPDERISGREATEAGADNWLTRPLKQTELLACIRDMLTIRRLRRKLAVGRSEGEATAHLASEASGTAEPILDPITGFYRFKAFKEILFREVKRAKRHQFPVSLALIACDPSRVEGAPGLRQKIRVEILRQLSMVVRRTLRDIDLPVSYSPDNILILMPHTQLEGAVTLARRLQGALTEVAFEVEGARIHPTLSIGLASSVNLDDFAFSDLVKSATRALLGAIESGGDRILFEQE